MAAPNPCGTLEGINALIDEILRNIYDENERILGEIIYDARCSVIGQYFPDEALYGPAVLYTTFGDPALRIKYPDSLSVGEYGDSPAHSALRLLQNPVVGDYVRLGFTVSYASTLALSLYDTLGARVRTLSLENVSAGAHQCAISLKGLAAGVYFLELSAGHCRETTKLVLLR